MTWDSTSELHGSTLWWLKVGKSLQVDLGRFSTIFKRVEAIVMPFVPSLSNKLHIYIYIYYFKKIIIIIPYTLNSMMCLAWLSQ